MEKCNSRIVMGACFFEMVDVNSISGLPEKLG